MSLVEVTIALGITAFAVIVIMALLATALGQNSDSSERAILVKIFRHMSESARSLSETNNRTLPWQADWAYSQDGLSCDLGDTRAYYRAHASAEPGVSWPGTSSSNAWTVRFAITNIPKNRIVTQRTAFVVKEPPAVP